MLLAVSEYFPVSLASSYMAEFSSNRPYTILLNLSFLFLISCLTAHLHCSSSGFPWSNSNSIANYNNITEGDKGCKILPNWQNKQEKCSYVKSHEGCKPSGYIPYLQLFYCSFSPVLGTILLALWLVLLFYLLGDTASNYFCHSLAGLSKILNLSPAIAGATLLSLGNGAPDVFSSIISFTGDGTVDIGLNSILGGAFFVCCLVVGSISISASSCGRKISRPNFIRDVVFLLLSLSSLLLITILGKINLWGALSFLSLYLIYVFFISTSSILPITKNLFEENGDGSNDLEAPLLCSIDNKGPDSSNEAETQAADEEGRVTKCFHKILCILELPLYLPRRLTIPVVSEDRWSKPLAVVSVTLAPIALALTWNLSSTRSGLLLYSIGGSVGIACGILAFCTTERLNPPRKFLLLWLAEGFIMSITWTYLLAQELISLLVSVGLILDISHSLLGLTVLAWGNSVGDLVANITMANKGGPQGTQVAISGSYAGPIFNTIVGLGLSLTFSAWTTYPAPYALSVDRSVFISIGFFMMALIWALVIVPNREMRIGKCLGSGLMAIYLCFLSLQLAISLHLLQIHVPPS